MPTPNLLHTRNEWSSIYMVLRSTTQGTPYHNHYRSNYFGPYVRGFKTLGKAGPEKINQKKGLGFRGRAV